MKLYTAVFSTLLIMMAQSAMADTLYLTSGDQLIGTIISETETNFIVDVNGVPVSVAREDVESVIRGQGEQGGNVPSPAGPSSPFGTIDAATETQDSATGIPGSTTETATEATPMPGGPLTGGTVENTTPEGPQQPLLPALLPRGNAYVVVGNGVVFRAGPGISFDRVTTLPGRSLLIGIEESQGWIHARTPEGQKGWIHPNFVSPMESTPCLVTGDQLNVRTGPDEVFQRVTRLRKGSVVMKLEEKGAWWRVLTKDGESGWCNQSYLTPLFDETLYRPDMRIVTNEDAGQPVLLQRVPESAGQMNAVFTLRYDPLLMNGVTKLIVFHQDRELFNSETLSYMSEDIIQRERLATSSAIVESGLPEELALQYIGADILTMLGQRVDGAWEINVILPERQSISFGMIVQQGEQRGTIVTMN